MEDITWKMQMHMLVPILMEDIYVQNAILMFKSKIHMESLALRGKYACKYDGDLYGKGVCNALS
jgi:hypothetical protein